MAEPLAAMSRSRLEAFSDGVFAIVITLLVLDLHGPVAHQSIASALAHERYAIAAYVVAFIGVGELWVNHHGVFRNAARLDRSLVFANLVFLLLVTATPFTAMLFADGLERGGADAETGAAVFSVVFSGVAVAFSVLWLLVTRPTVLSDDLDPRLARRALRRFGLGAVPYLVLIGVSFVSPLAVLVIFGVLGLYYGFDQLDPSSFRRAGAPAASD